MTPPLRRVFVLGAGFTRAFLPKAPLLTDHSYNWELKRQFQEFSNAQRLLILELNRNGFGENGFGEINVERLMTRLDGGMPYDSEMGFDSELGLLLRELKDRFLRRLQEAKDGEFREAELVAFARYCVEKGITCITFNYDDVFDEALWKVKGVRGDPVPPYWHPDGGYGFFCRPSETCIRAALNYMDKTAMLLLKLHGSVNWRIKRGYFPPYSVDAFVHHETWSPFSLEPTDGEERGRLLKDINLHLEPGPLIVPPVLVKSSLVQQPILKLVWTLAYRELEAAEEVTFVGYSLPHTDIAAGFLFSEALHHIMPSRIHVVNLAADHDVQETVKDAYRDLFPDMIDDQFEFRDARDWALEMVEGRNSSLASD